jgi:hypothetical protein
MVWVLSSLIFLFQRSQHWNFATAFWEHEPLCDLKSKLHYDRRSVGQSVLVSSRIWGRRPDSCYCQTFASLSMWGVLSGDRTGLSFTIAAGHRQNSHIYRTWIPEARVLMQFLWWQLFCHLLTRPHFALSWSAKISLRLHLTYLSEAKCLH